jgi:hypothetical protein
MRSIADWLDGSKNRTYALSATLLLFDWATPPCQGQYGKRSRLANVHFG